MRWLTPPPLAVGDQVALISPASPVKDDKALERAARHLKSLGLKVQLGRHARSRHFYLAGNDEQRRTDFMEALQNPAIRGLICSRGGYGTSRLLAGFDTSLLRRYPKLLMGYSDITQLHLAYEQQKVHSYWGPMPASQTGFSTYSKTWFKTLCMDASAAVPMPLFIAGDRIEVLLPGQAQGRLSGGTLTLLAASLGTAAEFHSRGKLVFLEDIDEPPYKLDRMLTQLLLAGKLKDAKGFVLGQFHYSSDTPDRDRSGARRVLLERLGPLGLPIVAHCPLGHGQRQLVLPYGRQARLDTKIKQLFLLP